MVFQDDSNLIAETKSTAKLACPDPESSSNLEQCCSPSCVHCNANLFKMIKSEIKPLTTESDLLKYSSNDSTSTPSFTASFPFETQRSRFYTIVDEWRTDRMEHISFIYQKKRNQIDFICSQIWHEFEIFKIEQNTLSHGNLLLNQPTTNSKMIPTITIPNEIEQLNQKLSLTRHLLDYFIQPHLNHHHSLSDDDEDDGDDNLNGNDNSDESSDDRNSSVNYEETFLEKPMQEFPLCTDNLAMASSNSHLLLRDGARLILFNEREKLHQLEIKVQHPGDFIRDLCWCEALGYYLVLTQYLLFIYDPDKFTLTIIDKVKPIERLKFSSLTCSDNIMFLVNGNGQCIERWLIGKNFQWKLIKRWPENEFCHENFRLTSRIRANHLVLALNICDQHFGYRICLYDYHMKFLRRINSDFNLHLLSYMHGNQWIATDYKEHFYIFHDDREDDGSIKAVIDYHGKGGYIRNICRLSTDYIAVKIINRLQIYRV